MHPTRARLLSVLLSIALLACGEATSSARPALELKADTLSVAELSRGMRSELRPSLTDGTPLGDSLARIAHTSYWLIEGGGPEVVLGERMLRYVYRRGIRESGWSVADLQAVILAYAPDPQAWRTLADDALAQEPTLRWALAAREAADSAMARKARQGSVR